MTLSELRQRAGHTQRSLAKAIGTWHPHVSSWENGHEVPSTPYIRALSLALGVSADVVLDALKVKPPNRIRATARKKSA